MKYSITVSDSKDNNTLTFCFEDSYIALQFINYVISSTDYVITIIPENFGE